MTELAFAKTFLTTLDSKPAKYPANHVFDPATFEIRHPYVLPKLAHPPHPEPPRAGDVPPPAPGAEPASSTINTINVTLKSSRNPNMTLSLPDTAPSTTIASLKEQVQAYLGGPAVVKLDKIKVLQNKKPVPASKVTVSDIVDDIQAAKDLELGVMVMGGAPDPLPQQPVEVSKSAAESNLEKSQSNTMDVDEASTAKEAVQPGQPSGEEILQTSEFWNDLEGFLAQRTKNQAVAISLRRTFESAWQSSSAAP